MWFTDALGTTVLARSDAERLGKVRRMIVDVDELRISALHIDGRKKKALLVDWDALVGFGPDAVVVAVDDALRGPADDRELAIVSGDLDWIGRRVLTDGGDRAGAVEDVEFDPSTGAITMIATDHQHYEADRLRALGPYCVIVRA